jgi:putative transposase
MKFETSHVYHVYNEGNNRQELFKTHEDYKQFLNMLKSYILPYSDIIAWCLLPNYFHLMLRVNEKGSGPHQQGGITIDLLTNGFRKLTSSYAQDFNKRNNRSGALFRPKTKAKDLTVYRLRENENRIDYYVNCFYYIHQNPCRHQLVSDLAAWKYSSFPFFAGERANDICNKQLAIQICGYDKAIFLQTVYCRIPTQFLDFLEQDRAVL